MRLALTCILIALITHTLTAKGEMRIWTDRKGNVLEAEYAGVFSGKVVLRTAEGKHVKVPTSGLCEEDQIYLKTAIPPAIETSVYIDRDTTALDSGSDSVHKREDIHGKVTLRKTNRDPSSVKFTAQLFIFTKEHGRDHLKVLDKTEQQFTFEEQETIQFTGELSSIKYRHWDHQARKEGEQYKGYLLVVLDGEGKLFCTKGSDPDYERNAETIRPAEKGSRIDSKFKVMEEKNKEKDREKKKK